MKRRKGFTLIEVLIVIVVIAVLASIVIPRLLGAGRQAKEASLRAHLQELRNSIGLFQSHTGVYPAALADIMGAAAPASGLDVAGAAVAINASDYKGPYLTTASGNLPENPITNAVDWVYGTVAPDVGAVHAPAGGALDGTDYSTW
ncbi:MAG: prepilin-type N-terminal cleavage/methylation domain-containing protein [Armatimonadota bacterium]|jgi:prepilin-type N-terminal cleavage/methylation domain-containing protein